MHILSRLISKSFMKQIFASSWNTHRRILKHVLYMETFSEYSGKNMKKSQWSGDPVPHTFVFPCFPETFLLDTLLEPSANSSFSDNCVPLLKFVIKKPWNLCKARRKQSCEGHKKPYADEHARKGFITKLSHSTGCSKVNKFHLNMTKILGIQN